MGVNKKNIPGKVDWVINDSCNYRCGYCYVSNESKNAGHKVEKYKFFIKGFQRHIPRGWNFNLVGGEPFLHPDFFDIVKSLIKSGYTISVVTNFSAPAREIEKFFKITEGKLVLFHASLHLEYDYPEIFLKKILSLKKIYPNFNNFFVSAVALPEKINYLEEVYRMFREANILFKMAPLRTKDDQYYNYSKSQQEAIRRVNRGIKKTINFKKLLNTEGKMCDCGYKFFLLSPYGEAYRCNPGSRSKNGYLGNILKNNFSLYSKPEVCKEKSCYILEKYTIYDNNSMLKTL
ncbi:MAG TPA: radical SAM protein [Candidatus Portnoybacteria bacterium]|nr:radical SAM protein [Candidatus Portnoybacteria bacterium]